MVGHTQLGHTKPAKADEAVSTGLRFTTIPPAGPLSPNSPAPSPPTTLTLLYNPLMGFLSSAYSAQVSPTVAISSRFGVNVYSYESDLSIGGEWWIGRRRGKREQSPLPSMEEQRVLENKRVALDEASLREEVVEERLDSPIPLTTNPMPSPSPSSGLAEGTNLNGSPAGHGHGHAEVPSAVEERDGVLKARISGDWVSPLLSTYSHMRWCRGLRLTNSRSHYSTRLVYENA